MNAVRNQFLLLFLAGMGLACGAESSSPDCRTWSDCGDRGRAFCLNGSCSLQSPDGPFGSVNIALSFGRDDYQVAVSGRVHFIHGQRADGSALTCEMLLDGTHALDDPGLNPLQTGPKYLAFHWTNGGTYFPDNLIQLIHPCDGALAVAEGFSQLNAGGNRTAFGCATNLDIGADAVSTLTVQLSRLPAE